MLNVQLGAVREAGRVLLIAAAPIAVSVTFYVALLADCVVPLKMWLTSPCTDVQRCVVERQVALLGGTGAVLRTAQRPLRGGGGRLLLLAHWLLCRSALRGGIERSHGCRPSTLCFCLNSRQHFHPADLPSVGMSSALCTLFAHSHAA